jgi:site-specific recombinase XerD
VQKGVQISPWEAIASQHKNFFIMARLSFYHDTRSGKSEFPLKIRISHKKEKAYINTGVKISVDFWSDADGVVIGHEKAKTYNAVIGSKMKGASEILDKLELGGKIDKYSAVQLKEIIDNNGEIKEEVKRCNFKEYYLTCMERKTKSSTKSSYQQTLNNLERFDPLFSERNIEEIDLIYMQRLDAWFAERNVTVNSRAVYYRNIRTVFNDALKEELTENYPFKRFKIKTTPTAKRNISVEELRLLKDYPIKDAFQQKYRDIFMLCFYLRGINVVDLFRMKPSDIRLNRLNYIRAKTGKPYSVFIEPEAWEIINRYKGVEYLIDVCDGAVDKQEWETKYKGFLKRMDRGLKKIGPYKIVGQGGKRELNPILPFISQYWCRHTCATLMCDLDITFATISASLGHDHGLKVTNIYIEYNEKKVDKANRQLIDYVNEKCYEDRTRQGVI